MDSLPLLLLLLGLWLPLQTWAIECGYRPLFEGPFSSPSVGLRIVGGWKAKPGQWPWMVSVQTTSYHFCGGSIIHPWWILSAAHCFIKERDQPIRVQAGSLILGRSNMTRWVQKIIMHPKYSTKTYDNDVALLLLKEPIPPAIFHSPICLPDDSIIPDDNIWEDCFVAGWGLTRAPPVGKEGSSELLEVKVDIIDWRRCNSWVRVLTKNMLCAGLERGGRDSCQGDSGGPLMCHPPTNGRHLRWYEVGVVSFGNGCGASKSPGIYAKVANYDYWIKDTTKHNGRPLEAPLKPTRRPVVGGQQQWGGQKPPGGQQQWGGQKPSGGQPQTEEELWDEDLEAEESNGPDTTPLLSWTWTSLGLASIWLWLLH